MPNDALSCNARAAGSCSHWANTCKAIKKVTKKNLLTPYNSLCYKASVIGKRLRPEFLASLWRVLSGVKAPAASFLFWVKGL
jgi:hypothetical protein